MELPPEILRLVMREATILPSAFDTSLESTIDEDRTAVQAAITESLACKSALSLVSKVFHEAADEFLFEVISLRKAEYIRPLALLLREERSDKPTRGWWCRRLDIVLRDRLPEWEWASVTLWGLLPACPRLLDIRCSNVHPNVREMSHIKPLQFQYHVPVELLQTIAALYGEALKRLELYGKIEVGLDDARSLLMHCPALEICRFTNLSIPSIASSSNGDYQQANSRQEIVIGPMHDNYGLDSSDYEEYMAGLYAARWPVTTGTDVQLPRLHTVDLRLFSTELDCWTLPALRAVTAAVSHLRTETRVLEDLMRGLGSYAASITHFTYYGPPFDTWSLVEFLPLLKRLTIHINYRYLSTALLTPHAHLDTIVLFVERYDRSRVDAVLQNIFEGVQDGKLPALRTVRLGYAAQEEHVAFRRDEYLALGINLELSERASDRQPVEIGELR